MNRESHQELELALTLPPYTTETRKGVQLAIENSTNMDADERRAAIEEIWTAIIQIHESRNNRVGVAEAIGSQIAARRDQAPEDYSTVIGRMGICRVPGKGFGSRRQGHQKRLEPHRRSNALRDSLRHNG